MLIGILACAHGGPARRPPVFGWRVMYAVRRDDVVRRPRLRALCPASRPEARIRYREPPPRPLSPPRASCRRCARQLSCRASRVRAPLALTGPHAGFLSGDAALSLWCARWPDCLVWPELRALAAPAVRDVSPTPRLHPRLASGCALFDVGMKGVRSCCGRLANDNRTRHRRKPSGPRRAGQLSTNPTRVYS